MIKIVFTVIVIRVINAIEKLKSAFNGMSI